MQERLPDWVNRELPEFTTPPYSMLGKSLSSFEHNVARTSECPLQYGGERFDRLLWMSFFSLVFAFVNGYKIKFGCIKAECHL